MEGYRSIDSGGLFNRPRAHIAVIFILTLIAYLNSINSGFVGDDIGFVKDNVSIRSLGNLADFFFSPRSMASDPEWGTIIYRPLRTLSYAVDYALFGLYAPGYHATSLLLHLLAAAVFYFLALELFAAPLAAFFSALIFALHPVHIEAVSWIASRADIMGFIFFGLSVIFYIRYRKTGAWGLLALSLASSLVSYLSKETMVNLPGVIILYDLIEGERPLKERLRRIPAWVLFSALCLAYLAFRFSVTGRMSTTQGWWGGTPYSNFLMQAKATAIYLKLLVFPHGLTLHYLIEPVHTILDFKVLVSAASIASSLLLAAWFLKKDRIVFFLIIWFYLGLVPIANIIPNSFSMMAERYIYMPSAGPIAAMGYGLYVLNARGKSGARAVAVFVSALSALFILIAILRNPVYKDETAFYLSAIDSTPESAPSHKGLADQFYEKKDYAGALEHYGHAVTLDPGYVEAMIGQTLTHIAKRDIVRAVEAAEKAARLEETIPSLKTKRSLVRFNLGNAYKEAGDLERARIEWERSIEADPRRFEVHNNLGNFYLISGDYGRAIGSFNKTLELNPYNAETHYNIAMAYEATGEADKARSHYRRFAALAGAEYAGVVEDLRRRGALD